MRIFYLAILFLISMQSCSNSDAPMMEEVEMQMEEEKPMEEDMSGASLFQGDFVSSAHTTSGKATINEAKTTLSFSNFKTDNGPVLEVYLATNTSVTTYITLGAVKGVDGNYEYVLPNNVDYKIYNHVIIWCVDFKVNFGYAILK